MSSYASLHFFTDDPAALAEKLFSLEKDEKPRRSSALFEKDFPDYCNIMIVEGKNCVSLYDEYWDYEIIEEKADFFAGKTKTPCFFLSCFDGDILVYGAISGDRKTAGVIEMSAEEEEEDEEWGIPPQGKRGDLALIEEVTGLSADSLSFLHKDDAFEADPKIRELLPNPHSIDDVEERCVFVKKEGIAGWYRIKN